MLKISTNWYGSPNRGKVDIGWTVSPALSELAPTVLANFYANASNTTQGRDVFIAGASGVGYSYPGRYCTDMFLSHRFQRRSTGIYRLDKSIHEKSRSEYRMF